MFIIYSNKERIVRDTVCTHKVLGSCLFGRGLLLQQWPVTCILVAEVGGGQFSEGQRWGKGGETPVFRGGSEAV